MGCCASASVPPKPPEVLRGQIFIQTLSGASFAVEVEFRETVFSLKQRIQNIRGLFHDHQILYFNGNAIADTQTLADCKIQPGSIVYLILRMAS